MSAWPVARPGGGRHGAQVTSNQLALLWYEWAIRSGINSMGVGGWTAFGGIAAP
jgi:hypothetical protein